MSNYLIQGETLTNIANAIRTKTGKTDSIPTENMATEISNLPIYPLYDGAVEEINLAFTLNSDGASYSVSGIGNVTATDIVIPNTYNGMPVTQIYARAFRAKTFIKSVKIGNNIKNILDFSFSSCSALTSIDLGNSVEKLAQGCFSSSAIVSIILPISLKEIKSSAFEDCQSLTSIEIPDSVTLFGTNNTFAYCPKLTSVIIGSSISNMGNYTFYNDETLTSVIMKPKTPPAIGNRAFYGTSANLTIYVPAESVEAYKTATNWSAYASQIQPIQN